jgi:hypothetical protein
VATREIPCAASSLLTALVDGPEVHLVEVARTRMSVHYETPDSSMPVLSVCTPTAVQLPNSLVSDVLPERERDESQPRTTRSSTMGGGRLRVGETTWRVRRWWQPPRPSGLPRPSAAHLAACAALAVDLTDPPAPGVPLPRPSYDGLSPVALIGAGPGLTPAGDDVLAGALVAAYATGDPRLETWRHATRATLTSSRTTAVSRAMLHHALDGYATPELATLLTALCLGRAVEAPLTRLLAVGHTSGGALLTGVLHTLGTHHLEGAA